MNGCAGDHQIIAGVFIAYGKAQALPHADILSGHREGQNTAVCRVILVGGDRGQGHGNTAVPEVGDLRLKSFL